MTIPHLDHQPIRQLQRVQRPTGDTGSQPGFSAADDVVVGVADGLAEMVHGNCLRVFVIERTDEMTRFRNI